LCAFMGCATHVLAVAAGAVRSPLDALVAA